MLRRSILQRRSLLPSGGGRTPPRFGFWWRDRDGARVRHQRGHVGACAVYPPAAWLPALTGCAVVHVIARRGRARARVRAGARAAAVAGLLLAIAVCCGQVTDAFGPPCALRSLGQPCKCNMRSGAGRGRSALRLQARGAATQRRGVAAPLVALRRRGDVRLTRVKCERGGTSGNRRSFFKLETFKKTIFENRTIVIFRRRLSGSFIDRIIALRLGKRPRGPRLFERPDAQ